MRRDSVEEIISSIRTESPSPEGLDRIRKTFLEGIAQVRPLPSDGALTVIVFGCLVAFAVIATIPFGFLAVRSFSTYQKLLLYTTTAGCAALCSAAVVGQMIPGSKRNWQPSLPILCSVNLLAAVTSFIFGDFRLTRFVHYGIPCFLFGTTMAIVAFCLVFVFLRKGLVTSWLRGGASAGALAGLAGVSVLALHCPIQNAPHALVWHLGVIAAASLGGLLFGWIRD